MLYKTCAHFHTVQTRGQLYSNISPLRVSWLDDCPWACYLYRTGPLKPKTGPCLKMLKRF